MKRSAQSILKNNDERLTLQQKLEKKFMNLEPAPLQNLIIFFSSAIWLHWIAQTE